MKQYKQIMDAMEALLPHPTRENYMRVFELLCNSPFYDPDSTDITEMNSLLQSGRYDEVLHTYRDANPNYVLDPHAHLLVALAQHKVGNAELSQVFAATARGVCRGIAATGHGTPESPYLVTHASAAQCFVEFYLEKKPVGEKSAQQGERLLVAIRSSDGVDTWFDVSAAESKASSARSQDI